MATFPGGIFSWTTVVDNVDNVLATHPNSLAAEIIAEQTKIGVDSSVVSATLDYFLKHASGAYRTHQHDATSDDGAKLDWDNCWIDAVHSHASDAEGGILNTAGGVNGAALTGLTNIPAGAGEIPDTNKGFPVVLTTDVTGTLPTANGGTGATAAANAANGVCVLDASAKIAKTAFPFGTYDSGWFAIDSTDAQTHTKTHSLGTTKVLVQVYFSTNGTTDMRLWIPSNTGADANGRWHDTGWITGITTTQITLQIPNQDGYSYLWSDEDETYASGYARIIMLALE